jgi:hypothetical protein
MALLSTSEVVVAIFPWHLRRSGSLEIPSLHSADMMPVSNTPLFGLLYKIYHQPNCHILRTTSLEIVSSFNNTTSSSLNHLRRRMHSLSDKFSTTTTMQNASRLFERLYRHWRSARQVRRFLLTISSCLDPAQQHAMKNIICVR